MNLKHSLIDLKVQQELVRLAFPFFKTAIEKGILFIEGELKNDNWEDNYFIQVYYHSRDSNGVYIIKPNVLKHPDLHINHEGGLCLYYPNHISPYRNFWVTQDLIFQTVKWIYCYELWKINGHRWMYDEMPHGHFEKIGKWLL